MRYLSGFFKTIWTFFPSLLFIFLTIYCFWMAGQGKDMVVAFTEGRHRDVINPRIAFFLAIGFWVYVTWYSSRVMAYIKEKYSPITGRFLENYPSLAGNACFLVLELAVWQTPILSSPLSVGWATVLFVAGLILLYFAGRRISRRNQTDSRRATLWFWISFALFWLLLLVTAFTNFSKMGYLYWLFVLLLVLHVVYLFYINLHHANVNERKNRMRGEGVSERIPKGLFAAIMNYFCIPEWESGYFRWLNFISVAAILVDIAAIWWLPVARGIGPFPMLMLAFGVLLAFTSVVSALSARTSVNCHLILFLLAFFIGFRESHYVREIKVAGAGNAYVSRPGLESYLRQWVKRVPDSSGAAPYDVYFVLSNGGASRSGYWTAAVLGRLEDSSITYGKGDRFSNHLFCLSGTSGGGVGVATFFSLLHDRHSNPGATYEQSSKRFLSRDFFTYTAARMLGPDYFNYIFHFFRDKDRAAALEEGFERYADTTADTLYRPSFNQPFSQFRALGPDSAVAMPVLFVNTTRMQDGNPGVVTDIQLDSGWFGQRIDVLGLLDSNKDISMASAAILGARFPYLSPAGRIKKNYFVDGGYFDNSGAGVVQELIRGILNITKNDSLRGGILYKKIHRMRLRVLHIVNSPIDVNTNAMQPVKPIENDLFAPLITILGAYDMQTTVNDDRLRHYIRDINDYSGIPTTYNLVSLYESSREWLRDPRSKTDSLEPPYSMNWFMSDWTRDRIDTRLDSQPEVRTLIGEMKRGD